MAWCQLRQYPHAKSTGQVVEMDKEKDRELRYSNSNELKQFMHHVEAKAKKILKDQTLKAVEEATK